jgi:hypothetical protein
MRTSRNLRLLSFCLLSACGEDRVVPESSPDSAVNAPTIDAALDATVDYQPDPSCEYFATASGRTVLSCHGEWTVFWEMQPLGDESECPRWYDVGERAFVTLAEGISALACDTTCVYLPRGAALFVYCDDRGEGTSYVDGGPGQTAPAGECAPLGFYESSAGGGWYESDEAFAAAHPCP